MNHRLLALLTALCVLVGANLLPVGAVTIVCRMTGQVMPSVSREDVPVKGAQATVEMPMPCCHERVKPDTDRSLHFVISEQSCCHLRVATQPASAPSFLLPLDSSFSWALVFASAVIVAPTPTEVIAQQPICFRPSAPRAPPLTSASLRAPPVLS